MNESVVARAKRNFPNEVAARNKCEKEFGWPALKPKEAKTWDGHEQVPISKLMLNPKYQRPSQAKIIDIAKDFQYAAFQCISVYEPTMEVVDGQQRVTAAYLRGLDNVPVMFYKGEKTLPELAALFAASNNSQTDVNDNDNWVAKVTADNIKHCEAAIEEILNRSQITGERQENKKSGYTQIPHPEILIPFFVDLGSDRFDCVIKSYRMLCKTNHKSIHAVLLRALFLLEAIALESNVSIVRASHITSLTLTKYTQINKLRQKIQADAHPGRYSVTNIGPEAEAAFAKVIIDRYNAGKKDDEPVLKSLS